MKPNAPPASYPDQPQQPPAAADDGTLVARLGAGDEQALGTLYDRWQGAVRAMALRIVQDASESDDVVEEVFWQAWRQAGRFDGARGGVSTWLLTIARSRSLDRLRALKRSREDAGLEGADEQQEESAWSTPSNPGALTELNEQGRLIRAALAELPDEQRIALQLGYFEGLSQTEIAERTGLPLGTVKTRMRLALRKLREKLGVLREDA
jgi:RNA polymerase sigma-70 factor (ECF subfamily)